VTRHVLPVALLLGAIVVGVPLLQRHFRAPGDGDKATEASARAVPSIRGKPVAEFALPDLEGKTVRPADFQNKVLIVNFWATWCGPCIVEIPWFIDFQKRYGPKGLQIVGIALDRGGKEDVQPFVEEHKMTYPILLGNGEVVEQFGGLVGLPTTFVVDRDGKYYSMYRGLASRKRLEQELQDLLGTPAEAAPEESESLFELFDQS
jgi:thiol-disulfide isomerase/thioredoxin